MQCSQFAFVRMYIVYIYICHTLIAWARFLWSRTGPTRRRSTCEKDRARAKMEQEQSKCDHARERKRKVAARLNLRAKTETRLAFLHRRQWLHHSMYLCIWRLAQHFAHFLKLFRQPLCHLHRYTSSPAPSTYTLHMVTTDIYLHISRHSSARGILCACVFLVTIEQGWRV